MDDPICHLKKTNLKPLPNKPDHNYHNPKHGPQTDKQQNQPTNQITDNNNPKHNPIQQSPTIPSSNSNQIIYIHLQISKNTTIQNHQI